MGRERERRRLKFLVSSRIWWDVTRYVCILCSAPGHDAHANVRTSQPGSGSGTGTIHDATTFAAREDARALFIGTALTPTFSSIYAPTFSSTDSTQFQLISGPSSSPSNSPIITRIPFDPSSSFEEPWNNPHTFKTPWTRTLRLGYNKCIRKNKTPSWVPECSNRKGSGVLEGIHIYQPRAVKAWEQRVPDWVNVFAEMRANEHEEEGEECEGEVSKGQSLSPWCLLR